jgi:hypothetical protein
VILSFLGHPMVTCCCCGLPHRVIGALMLCVGGCCHSSYLKGLGSSLDSPMCLDLDRHTHTTFFAIWFPAPHWIRWIVYVVGNRLVQNWVILYFTR